MKICILASYAPSLIIFRGDLIKEILARGYEVHCLAPDIDKDTEFQLKQLGCQVTPIDIERTGVNPVKDLKQVLVLISFFRTYRPDVLISYTIKPVIYGSISAWISKVPKRVALITGLGMTFSKSTSIKVKAIQTISKSLYRVGLKFVNTAIFHNLDDLHLMVDQNIVAKKRAFVVNGSGVNLRKFPKKAIPNTNKISMVMISRLLRDKGVYEYISAARAIKSEFPNVEFNLVGWIDNSPGFITEEELSSWVSEGVVNFMGKLQDVSSVLENCHIYVCPSYREGIPRTVLEAMATGRAILTTSAPGCKETVIENKNGLICPAKNSNALYENMKHLLQNPDDIVSMGNESYKLVCEKFDVVKVNLEMLRIMDLDK